MTPLHRVGPPGILSCIAPSADEGRGRADRRADRRRHASRYAAARGDAESWALYRQYFDLVMFCLCTVFAESWALYRQLPYL